MQKRFLLRIILNKSQRQDYVQFYSNGLGKETMRLEKKKTFYYTYLRSVYVNIRKSRRYIHNNVRSCLRVKFLTGSLRCSKYSQPLRRAPREEIGRKFKSRFRVGLD